MEIEKIKLNMVPQKYNKQELTLNIKILQNKVQYSDIHHKNTRISCIYVTNKYSICQMPAIVEKIIFIDANF